jgi:hypothetical protein
MRLAALPCVWTLAVLLAAPAAAQHALPGRSFAPSLPAVAPLPDPPVQEWWRSGGPRLRPTDLRLDVALRNGLERSALLRGLVSTIEANDVIVYAGLASRMTKGLSGRLTFVGSAGRYRYLRVMLNHELTGDLLIASLAHELRHVVEVIEHPEVRSEATLRDLYRQIGYSNEADGSLGWETDAAQDVAYEVRRELKLGTAAALARRD